MTKIQLLISQIYKTKKGFYERTKEKDENGRPVILALDLNTLEYSPSQQPDLPSLKMAKQIEELPRRVQMMFDADDRVAVFDKPSGTEEKKLTKDEAKKFVLTEIN